MAFTSILPSPVLAAALKNFTGAGAVAPAGNANAAYEIEFVAVVQVDVGPQMFGAAVIDDAVVGNV